MRLLLSLSAALALSLHSLGANAQSLEQQAASIIRSKGFWCERVADISPTLFGQTANKNTYRVFCDDGRENATYIMKVDRAGGYVTVREN